jgi:photosynthetic reaction center H subunit
MAPGSITDHIDLTESALVIFFLGFFATVWYLRRLDKREGYPMKASPFDDKPLLGYPVPPDPVTYKMHEGGETVAPHLDRDPPSAAIPLYRFDGTPLTPTGNPLLSCLGPGAWVLRRDEPMRTEKGEVMLKPLRELEEWSVARTDADPRGMTVFDRGWREIGTVYDIWVDRSIKILRLLEVELKPGLGPARVLVPIFHTHIREREREVRVTALDSRQFADVPLPARDGELTAREDDRLNAYYAAGWFHRDTVPGDAPAESTR